jgi:hypothetical protein
MRPRETDTLTAVRERLSRQQLELNSRKARILTEYKLKKQQYASEIQRKSECGEREEASRLVEKLAAWRERAEAAAGNMWAGDRALGEAPMGAVGDITELRRMLQRAQENTDAYEAIVRSGLTEMEPETMPPPGRAERSPAPPPSPGWGERSPAPPLPSSKAERPPAEEDDLTAKRKQLELQRAELRNREALIWKEARRWEQQHTASVRNALEWGERRRSQRADTGARGMDEAKECRSEQDVVEHGDAK